MVKDKVIGLRVSKEKADDIEKVMKNIGMSQSEFINTCFDTAIDTNGGSIKKYRAISKLQEALKELDQAFIIEAQFKPPVVEVDEKAIKAIDSLVSPLTTDYRRRRFTETQLVSEIKQFAKARKLPIASLIPSLLERISIVYGDNEPERDRLIQIVQGMQAGDQQ